MRPRLPIACSSLVVRRKALRPVSPSGSRFSVSRHCNPRWRWSSQASLVSHHFVHVRPNLRARPPHQSGGQQSSALRVVPMKPVKEADVLPKSATYMEWVTPHKLHRRVDLGGKAAYTAQRRGDLRRKEVPKCAVGVSFAFKMLDIYIGQFCATFFGPQFGAGICIAAEPRCSWRSHRTLRRHVGATELPSLRCCAEPYAFRRQRRSLVAKRRQTCDCAVSRKTDFLHSRRACEHHSCFSTQPRVELCRCHLGV